ncbi:MAG TPA: TAXI family TRAP transporter solute-binding subunit [Candidatus Megaira endosymbiont of Stentor roeselii]|nr:TAXI family TRAP transporter solute-binding subunit [Candidatus Megaera endosymbiont of Stentor roeselii]
MPKFKLLGCWFVCSVFTIVFSVNSTFAENIENEKTVKIAAGSVLEGYYFIGLRLCRYITESNNGIRCEVVPTTGSLENIDLLRKGEVDFAFTQAELAVDAYEGKGYFNNVAPFPDMIQLLRLHDEAFTVIAKDKDKIFVFGDLDGKKISNGPKNSDSTIAYNILASHYKFKKQPEDIEIPHEEYANQFCSGKVDAIILMTGHPNSLVNYITHSCESDFVSIEKDKIDMLVEQNQAFKKYIIDEKGYPGINKSENTFAVSAIFITTNSVPKKLISNLTQYLKKRMDQFKLSYPLLYDLENDHFTSGFVLPGFEHK